MNALISKLQREEQDSALVTSIIGLLLLFLFIFPVLRMTMKAPTQVAAISVVFNTPPPPVVEEIFTPVPQEEAKKTTPKPQEAKKAQVKTKAPDNTPPPAKAPEVIKETVAPAPTVVEAKTVTEKSAEVLAAEAKAKREAEEAAKAAKLKASKSAFGSLFSDAGNGTPEESSEIGGQNSDALDDITSGMGTVGEGLSSRGVTYRPKITDNSDREGIVIVKVCINADGKVISADYVQGGSTTTDQTLVSTAIKGAKQYRFEGNPAAPKQCGDITIEFEVR